MSPDPDKVLAQRLRNGLSATGLQVSAEAQRKLIAYIRLLAQWNKVYSLTAVRDPLAMVTRHLLDCLVLLPYLRGDCMADLGSGAGPPGLVLAIARPEQQWVLLESRLKKTRFLTQALIELKLENVSVARERVETYQAPIAFSTFTARGFGKLPQVFASVQPLCRGPATLLVMKGIYPGAELAELKRSYPDPQIHRLTVPELAAERHVVVMNLLGTRT
ncbi:MAG: 16S rRNA (guanine(527)-N(7))-methyltransferase RsmG [Gammaproteobacteria bacterium]